MNQRSDMKSNSLPDVLYRSEFRGVLRQCLISGQQIKHKGLSCINTPHILMMPESAKSTWGGRAFSSVAPRVISLFKSRLKTHLTHVRVTYNIDIFIRETGLDLICLIRSLIYYTVFRHIVEFPQSALNRAALVLYAGGYCFIHPPLYTLCKICLHRIPWWHTACAKM